MDTDDIRNYCRLDDESLAVIETTFRRLNISARAYDRILRVARTIADLDCASYGGPSDGGHIEKRHVMEAIQMRSLDKYWSHT